MTKINFPISGLYRLAKISMLIGCALLLSNCADMKDFANGDISKYSDADFGTYYKDYKEQITNMLIKSAKNPDSIKIRKISSAPRKVLIQNSSPSALWEPYFPGYGICVEYGGTNSYGGFIVKEERFYIRNGKWAPYAYSWKGFDPCLLDDLDRNLSKHK